jgi:multidrug efflux pump subunit AcrB
MKGPNLSAAAVNNPSLTLFIILMTALAGVIAFLQLGRAEDPAFTVKTMVVTAAWPGATAAEMQNDVADRLEKRLQELRWFDRVETTARPGFVTMQVLLTDNAPPSVVAEEWYQVRKKLSDEATRLPKGVIGPFFDDEFSDTYFALFALQGEGLGDRRMAGVAEAVRSRLLALPGVAKVNILGQQPERIYVEFDQARIEALGLTLPQVTTAIAGANTVTAAGVLQTGGPALALRIDDAPGGADSVRRLPVAVGGRVLTIGDIATVRRGGEDPASFVIHHQGKPALMLGVVMKPRWNGLALGEALAAGAEAVRAELPLGLTLTHVADQARVIDAAYGEFMAKFAVALAVVMIVSLAALGLRVGVVVALSVPLTLAAVFVMMLVTGRDFDRITLGALILALGLLVDDAIIAIEMMVVKMEEGMDRVAAATFAWGATAGPMLSGTLVTIAGFIPIGFAASSSGEYAGNIFWILAFALTISWLVAVYATPYLGVKLLPAIRQVAGGHEAIYATPRYRRLRQWVMWVIAHKRRVVAATFGALVVAGLGMALVKQQFFPSSDRTELLVEVQMPHGSAIGATSASVDRIERWLKTQPEVRTIDSYIGAGAPRFFLSLNPEPPDPAFAKIVVQTDGPADRDVLQTRLRRAVNDGLAPAARVRATTLLLGPPVPYPVVFRVHGPDIAVVRQTVEQVRAALDGHAKLSDVHLDYGERVPELRVVFDPARLAAIGLRAEEAARQAGAALSGQPVTQIRDGNRLVEVVVRASAADRTGAERLGAIVITAADGSRMPLANLGRIAVVPGEPMLRRWNREPFIAVRADVAKGVQPPDATAAVLPLLDPLKARLPPGYSIQTGGAVEEAGKANGAIAATAPVTLGFMLLFIMLQVRSFRLMGLTFATAPLGLIGAVLALLLFRQPFGFVAILGLIGLAGILMRNTLILVDQIQAEVAAGRVPHDAVVEATVRRARPVVLTALAAVLAFVPLTLSTFWGPLAFVLIGGVTVGTALTLFFLPALYALWLGVDAPATDTLATELAATPA